MSAGRSGRRDGGRSGAAGPGEGSPQLLLRGQNRGRPPSFDPVAREGPGTSLRLFPGTAEEARGLGRPGRHRRGAPSATGFSAWTGARPGRRGRGLRRGRPERRPGSTTPFPQNECREEAAGGWKERRRLRIPTGGRGREG